MILKPFKWLIAGEIGFSKSLYSLVFFFFHSTGAVGQVELPVGNLVWPPSRGRTSASSRSSKWLCRIEALKPSWMEVLQPFQAAFSLFWCVVFLWLSFSLCYVAVTYICAHFMILSGLSFFFPHLVWYTRSIMWRSIGSLFAIYIQSEALT